MIWRWMIAAGLGLLSGLWEVAVVPFVPPILGLRPLLPLAALLLVSSVRGRAFTCLVAGALLLDAYGWAYVDIATIRLSLVLLLLDSLSHRFLTNRSVYASIALIIIGRMLDWAGLAAFSFLGNIIDAGRYPWHLPINPWWVLVWDALFVGGGFLLLASFTRRFVTLGPQNHDF